MYDQSWWDNYEKRKRQTNDEITSMCLNEKKAPEKATAAQYVEAVEYVNNILSQDYVSEADYFDFEVIVGELHAINEKVKRNMKKYRQRYEQEEMGINDESFEDYVSRYTINDYIKTHAAFWKDKES